jgi:hypothetical protein
MTQSDKSATVVIAPPRIETISLKIIGTAPLMINRFSSKAQAAIEATQMEGQAAKGKKKRESKDFEMLCREAAYVSAEGWYGFNAAAIRNAAISACRTVGFTMTRAKLAIFVLPDGFDRETGTPLVRIYGDWQMDKRGVRNANKSLDVRARPRWDDWYSVLRIQHDADMISTSDVVNLLHRVGLQVGIGEGRNDSSNGAGFGFGSFRIEEAA